MRLRILFFALASVALLACLNVGAADAQLNWHCKACAEFGECYACCRCAGGTTVECVNQCGLPFSGLPVAAATPSATPAPPPIRSATGGHDALPWEEPRLFCLSRDVVAEDHQS